MGVGSEQFVVDVDDNIDGQECNQAACLHIAMEVDGRVVGEVRSAEIEVPGHFRNISDYVYILETLIQIFFRMIRLLPTE